jgi:hypothetical protein
MEKSSFENKPLEVKKETKVVKPKKKKAENKNYHSRENKN